ncbi:MAG: GatB/YqeY domain-containing protein [Pyrinomonadaceae bacterium]
MSHKQQIISDLTASMKARDTLRTSVLRMVKAAIMNREIEKGGELTDDEAIRLLNTLVKQRHDSMEQFDAAGRTELAEKERAEIVIIESYLPKAASPEEIEKAIKEAISETGATSARDMGKVMKTVQSKLAGRNADNRTISEIVKSRLAT